MNTPAFFWHYLRRYTGWAMLAAVGIVAYAGASGRAAREVAAVLESREEGPA